MGIIKYFLTRKKPKTDVVYRRDEGTRRSPTDIIKSGNNPSIEHAYVKLPGKNIIEVSLELFRNEPGVWMDEEKIERLLKRYNKESYSALHTHPGWSRAPAFPSFDDLKKFLTDNKIKTMFIAQQNVKTGKVEGYFCLRKTKKTKLYREDDFDKITEDVMEYDLWAGRGVAERMDSLKKLTKDYNLQFKHLPSKGYELGKDVFEGYRFIRKRPLEKIVASMIGLCFIGSIFFLSFNLTGFTIFSLDQIKLSWIGRVLFILGVIGLFYYFNKKYLK